MWHQRKTTRVIKLGGYSSTNATCLKCGDEVAVSHLKHKKWSILITTIFGIQKKSNTL